MEANQIQVAVRVRPLTVNEASRIPEAAENNHFLGDGNLISSPSKVGTYAGGGMLREVVDVVDHRTLIFDKPDTNVTRAFMTGGKSLPGARKYRDQRYAFDHVFNKEATQDEVFDHTARTLLPGLFDGLNATLFAYGATGCGKTHTVSGTKDDPGIIYRTMKELYSQIEDSRDEWETHVTVSFLEIYNELIRDLLSDDYPSALRLGLSLREDEKNRITVAGLSQKVPKSADEVLEYVLLGNSRRTCSPTHANAESSRSHAVLQVSIGRRPRGGDVVDMAEGTVSTSISSATLSIIDLAGSERASATQNMGNRMKEGANINKSLLALGNCINALCMPAARIGSTQHIPYRDSKLTRLLKFSLGGNCRTFMIVCVSPCSIHLEDTGNTLKYANRAKNIQTKVSKNINGVERNITQYLKAIEEKNETIRQLQIQLADRHGEKTAVQRRKEEEAKREADKAISEIRTKTASYLPGIIEGASYRAMWDAAELRIAAMSRHLAILPSAGQGTVTDAAERSLIDSLIAREHMLYGNNPDVQAKLQQHSTQSSFMEMLLRSMQERKFEKLDEADVANVRLEASLQRSETTKAQLEARERAYRASIQAQAEAVTGLLSALLRISASMREKASHLRELTGEEEDEAALMLETLAEEGESITKGIHGAKVAPMATSALRTSPAYKEKLFGPPTAARDIRRLQVPLAKPSKRQPISPPLANGPAKHSPAVRRLFGQTPTSRFGSPMRMFSPKKRSKPVGSVMKSATGQAPERKKVTWRDEAGEGNIGEIRQDSGRQPVTSSEEESPPPTPALVGQVEETVWEDEMTGDNIAGDSGALGPPVRPAVLTSVPDWKRNRLLNRSAATGFGPVNEDDSLISSPDGPSRPKKALGGPIRPMTGTLQTQPRNIGEPLFPSNNSVSNASHGPPRRQSIVGAPTRPKPFSFLANAEAGPSSRRQSISAAAKSGLNAAGLPSASGSSNRRLSSVGPMRNERKKSRSSLLPVAEDGHSYFQSSPARSEGRMVQGFLFGGIASAASPSNRSSPKKAVRRSSIKPPRPSMLGSGNANASSPATSAPATANSTRQPAILRAAMPTLSSQNRAVPNSLRRPASTMQSASTGGDDTDHVLEGKTDSPAAPSGTAAGAAMRPLSFLKH